MFSLLKYLIKQWRIKYWTRTRRFITSPKRIGLPHCQDGLGECLRAENRGPPDIRTVRETARPPIQSGPAFRHRFSDDPVWRNWRPMPAQTMKIDNETHAEHCENRQTDSVRMTAVPLRDTSNLLQKINRDIANHHAQWHD